MQLVLNPFVLFVDMIESVCLMQDAHEQQPDHSLQKALFAWIEKQVQLKRVEFEIKGSNTESVSEQQTHSASPLRLPTKETAL